MFEGITAAGTVPDSHRIPLHRGGQGHPITIKFAAKVQLFLQPTTILQKYSILKKQHDPKTHQTNLITHPQNQNRDRVDTSWRYLKSRYDTLNDCDLMLYEWLP